LIVRDGYVRKRTQKVLQLGLARKPVSKFAHFVPILCLFSTAAFCAMFLRTGHSWHLLPGHRIAYDSVRNHAIETWASDAHDTTQVVEMVWKSQPSIMGAQDNLAAEVAAL